MKRWFALALLVALPVAAQDRFPRCRSAQGRSDRGFACDPGYAFFEFAPASGAGLGAPCACAAVTGAKGETITWTRGSSAMCTKSASESSIANGDLVLCGNNLPRVMSLGGPLGVLVESSRTNDNLWSDDLSNAAYTSPLSGVAAVTVTAAFATGPTGATNATRLQFPATTGVQYSLRAQVAGVAAARTGSIYVKGNGTSGTIDLVWGGVGAQCAACAFNPTTWTRCSFPTASAVNTWEFGNDSADCASAARGAIDVLVAGVQSEPGAYATSYIPTTTVAVTRSADANLVPSVPVDTTGCVAATVTPLWSGSSGPVNPMVVGTNASRYLYLRSGFNQWASFDAVTVLLLADTWTGFTSYRAVSTWSGATHVLRNVTRGTSTSGAFDGTMGAPAFSIGADATLGQIDGIVSRVQLDPSLGVCQ